LGEIVVQFWLKPGEAAVTLGAGKEKGRADTGAVEEVFVNPAFRIKLSLWSSPKEPHVREAQVPVNRVVDDPA
jgi:hypothetical protein